MTDYIITCPKCKITEVELNFAGNNGYVGICKICKELLYYCSIFSKIDYFKPTGEHYDMFFRDMKYVPQVND